MEKNSEVGEVQRVDRVEKSSEWIGGMEASMRDQGKEEEDWEVGEVQ